MNARFYTITNTIGCVVLVVLILIQWKIGTGIEAELQQAKAEGILEHNIRVDVEKRAAGLESDINGLKASIDSIRADAEEKTKELVDQKTQSEQLHTALLQTQEQGKLMEEAIKARDEALKVRDEKLKAQEQAIAVMRRRLDEAIGKLKAAGAGGDRPHRGGGPGGPGGPDGDRRGGGPGGPEGDRGRPADAP